MTRKIAFLLGLSMVLLAGCGVFNNEKSAKSGDITDPTTAAPEPAATSDAHAGKLPTSCNSVLTWSEVEKAVGKKLTGRAVMIRGLAEKQIGRTGRFTCRFGLPPQQPKSSDGNKFADIPVEVGISAYRTADLASQRIDYTVEQQRPETSSSKINLGSITGTMLSGKGGAMLVFADQRLTYAVSVSDKVISGDSAKQALLAMANNVLEHSA